MSAEEDSTANCKDNVLQLLQRQRNRITNAGKYMDRYKNEFKRPESPLGEAKYSLSARYRGKNDELLYSGCRGRSRPNSPSVAAPSPKVTRTPVAQKKHNKNVNIYEVTSSPNSEIRNIEISLKFGSPSGNTSNSDTLNCLQHVENYITMCETKAANNKFIEMVKTKNNTNSCDNKLDHSDSDKPLYNSPEMENLLKSGLSDMKCNESEVVERGTKVRTSMGGAKRKDGKPLMRTLSDAKATDGRKIRNNLQQAKKVLE